MVREVSHSAIDRPSSGREASVNKDFQFDDGGRAYACRIEAARPSGTEAVAWWWFSVSGDDHRYAPFVVGAEDTEQSVKWRIIAFYDRLRGVPREPYEPRSSFHRGARTR